MPDSDLEIKRGRTTVSPVNSKCGLYPWPLINGKTIRQSNGLSLPWGNELVGPQPLMDLTCHKQATLIKGSKASLLRNEVGCHWLHLLLHIFACCLTLIQTELYFHIYCCQPVFGSDTNPLCLTLALTFAFVSSPRPILLFSLLFSLPISSLFS